MSGLEELLIAKTSHATAKEEREIITFTPEMINEHRDSGGGIIL